MKVCVLLRTSEYRGDHASDVTIAHESLPGETVEALVARILTADLSSADWLELRRVFEPQDKRP